MLTENQMGSALKDYVLKEESSVLSAVIDRLETTVCTKLIKIMVKPLSFFATIVMNRLSD